MRYSNLNRVKLAFAVTQFWETPGVRNCAQWSQFLWYSIYMYVWYCATEKESQRSWKRWKRTRNATDKVNYNQARNNYARYLKYNEYKHRNVTGIEVWEKDWKKLYALVNKLTCKVDKNPMPKVDDLSTLQDKFAKFFSQQNWEDQGNSCRCLSVWTQCAGCGITWMLPGIDRIRGVQDHNEHDSQELWTGPNYLQKYPASICWGADTLYLPHSGYIHQK